MSNSFRKLIKSGKADFLGEAFRFSKLILKASDELDRGGSDYQIRSLASISSSSVARALGARDGLYYALDDVSQLLATSEDSIDKKASGEIENALEHLEKVLRSLDKATKMTSGL